MLVGLHIQDFVLIDQLALSLEEGLTALTGETGAGKSILLEALGLASGGRITRGSIRNGASKGQVAAAFEPLVNHPVWNVLEENGISFEDDQVILRRVQHSNGKSRAFVNDQPVSIALLRTIGETLIEIHGQNDGHGFLSANTHRDLLDEFGDLTEDVASVKEKWRFWQDAQSELAEYQEAQEKTKHDADYLNHVVEELSHLAPKLGEEVLLAEKRSILMASEKIAEDLSASQELLSENGFESRLAGCAHRLSKAVSSVTGENPLLKNAVEKIDKALSEVMEARSALDDAVSGLDLNPDRLGETEERLFGLRAAARKHGVEVDALPVFLERASASLADLETGFANLAGLKRAVEASKDTFMKASEVLSKQRLKAAAELDVAVSRELKPLKLGRAIFSTEIKASIDNASQSGIDEVEFVVATNPGAPAGPLKTIASGGELSRFVLAMKAALAAKESRTVIIFDEVDSGVGGAVADAVGERLARLARDAQVLVVTHSPQVAARAKLHWRVEKKQTSTETITRVLPLDSDGKIEELARMLSGAKITKEARAAATQLLGIPTSQKKRARA